MSTQTEAIVSIREFLRLNGFVLMKSAVPVALLEAAIEPALRTIEKYKDKLAEEDGGLPYCLPMPVKDHTALLDHAEELLKSIGADPYWLQNLMLIRKLPGEGRRYWHTDLPSIYAPAEEDAAELLVLYMLQPTTKENGALLVVPGYAEGPQHSERVTTPIEGEHAVETEMGDVIIMDPRLLHGSMPNDTDKYRFNVRLWIQTKWKEREC